MSRTMHCHKLRIDAPALERAPWPGPLGQRILAEISQPAWQQWLAHQTLLINENRLSPLDPKARAFLENEMQQFLFGDGAAKPAGYVAPQAD